MFDTPAARAATLQNLLSERALALEAEHENLLVPADRVRQAIAGQQAFQQGGKFSYERYQALLRAQGLTEAAFEQRVRADLQKQALLQAVADSSIVPRTVSEQVRRLIEEERVVREIRFMPGEFRARINVTDEQLNAFYEANQKDFLLPESARIEYVVLTLDDVARAVELSEAEALAYYEQNRTRWGQDEQRKASHILLTAGDGGSARDKAGARKQADQVLAQLRANPREFEKLARQFSKDPGSASSKLRSVSSPARSPILSSPNSVFTSSASMRWFRLRSSRLPRCVPRSRPICVVRPRRRSTLRRPRSSPTPSTSRPTVSSR